MTSVKSDVFMSYAHENKKIADRIKQDLIGNKISVWIDQGELLAGQLLVGKIQVAIKKTTNFVLLWSRKASRSRWVNSEWNAAWHLEKNIIPCTLDKEPVPPFLLGVLSCTFAGSYKKGIQELLTALVPKKPPASGERRTRRLGDTRAKKDGLLQLDKIMSADHLNVDIFSGQERVLNALDAGRLSAAKSEQKGLDAKVGEALRKQADDAEMLSLAAYHKKNAFQIKHWNELQSRMYPKDKLLDEAETLFYKSLAIEPDNPGAVNGLGSVLALRGDIDAAEFFVRRAIDLANKQGIDYGYAKEDLATIQRLKRERTRIMRPVAS
jgi:tetratricopeptide (TPR) repeat protein